MLLGTTILNVFKAKTVSSIDLGVGAFNLANDV